MTVAANIATKSFAGDDASTSFPLGASFVFFNDTDLVVSVVNDTTGAITELTLTTDYTVSGGGGATGTVDTSGGHGVLASGTTLVVQRVMPLTQPVDFVNGEISDAEVNEDAFDRLTLMVQQLDEENGRALRASIVEDAIDDLPTPVERRNKFLKFADTAAAEPSAIEITELSSGGTVLDEDDFSSDSTSDAPSQQSAAAYIATQLAAQNQVSGVETITSAESPKTLTAADRNKLFRVDASGGAVTLVLPAEATAGDGWSCQVYSADVANLITVEDDANTALWEMRVAGQSVVPITDATSWYNLRPGALLRKTSHTTSATHTYVPGAAVADVIVTGGGGGGQAGDYSNDKGGNGGSAGGTAILKALDVAGLTSETVTIGAAGAAGTGAAGAGGDGGNSSFGSHATANGGGGGDSLSNHGFEGTATGGDINLNGGRGARFTPADNLSSGVASGTGALGGSSYWGGGGAGGHFNDSGSSGSAPGSGGGGGGFRTATTSNHDGGAGAAGYVYVEEYA